MKNLMINKKIQFPAILFLIGLILMLSADIVSPDENAGNNSNEKESSKQGDTSSDYNRSDNITAERKELEKQVQHLLEAIGGVKSASVVITYENSGEIQVQQDKDTSNKKTDENDGNGGVRNVTEDTDSEKTVYIEGSDGSKYPFVVSEQYAQIRGVAVVVKGTYDESIREKIVRALEVLLSIPTHKIQVIW